MKFKTKFLREHLYLPWSALEDKILDDESYNVMHEIVFSYKGKYYMSWYSENLTAYPWQYEDEVDCKEVELKEVTEKKWVLV